MYQVEEKKYRLTKDKNAIFMAISDLYGYGEEFLLWQKNKKEPIKVEIINLNLSEFTLKCKEKESLLLHLDNCIVYVITKNRENAFKAEIKLIKRNSLTCSLPIEFYLPEIRGEIRKCFSDISQSLEIVAKSKSTLLTFHNAKLNDYSKSGLSITVNKKQSSNISQKDSILIHCNDLPQIQGGYFLVYKKTVGTNKVRFGLTKES